MDIHDLGEWWDLRWTKSMRRFGQEPGTHTKRLGTLGMEQYFMASTQTIAADGLSKSIRFQAFPPCP